MALVAALRAGDQDAFVGPAERHRRSLLRVVACRVRPPLAEKADERLIGDGLDGDPRLCARGDTVEAAWRIVEPVLNEHPPVMPGQRGTWGPAAADAVVHDHGGWRPCSGGA